MSRDFTRVRKIFRADGGKIVHKLSPQPCGLRLLFKASDLISVLMILGCIAAACGDTSKSMGGYRFDKARLERSAGLRISHVDLSRRASVHLFLRGGATAAVDRSHVGDVPVAKAAPSDAGIWESHISKRTVISIFVVEIFLCI